MPRHPIAVALSDGAELRRLQAIIIGLTERVGRQHDVITAASNRHAKQSREITELRRQLAQATHDNRMLRRSAGRW